MAQETRLDATSSEEKARLTFTLLTATKPCVLSKSYNLVDGQLEKTPVAALVAGRIETVSIDAPEGLIPLLAGLDNSKALMLGVAADPTASRIVTRRAFLETTTLGTVARTGEHFAYPAGPGFLMLDHDGLVDGRYLSPDELLEILYTHVPMLREVKIVIFRSSSSHICRTDTDEDLTGARGFHIYIPVANARDIPRAGQALVDRLWHGGHGAVAIAKNGNRLVRTPIDGSIWQPNRIIFASGAICGPGLKQCRGAPILINPDGADLLDTVFALPALDAEASEMVKLRKHHAVQARELEANRVREAWMTEHRKALLRSYGAPAEHQESRETLNLALDDQLLDPEFTLMVKRVGDRDFLPVTVQQVLNDRTGFHRATTLDPLEPDYNNSASVGCLFLDSRTPVLHSMAHGGATYHLTHKRLSIEIGPGRGPEIIEALLEHMRRSTRYYDYGDALVTVIEGERKLVDEIGLERMLGEEIEWRKRQSNDRMVPADPPLRVLRQLISMGKARGLRRLTAVLTHPTVTADGVLLDQPGFHAAYGIYLDFDPDDWPSMQRDLTPDQAKNLIRTIWQPFRAFPFIDAASRGAVLAAIITALMRSSFEIAPAFASDGPNEGVGKTLVLEAVIGIASGYSPEVSPPFGDESELRKNLTSMVLAGDRYVLFDNLEGYQHSPTLQAFLTGANWKDRLLSTNIMLQNLPIRMFVGMTATNITFSGDMHRRVLTWRIDPNMEGAVGRVFSWCPKEQAIDARIAIIQAVLSLTLAAQEVDLPPVHENLGKYGQWERIVRRTLRYIEVVTEGYIVDPVPQAIRAVKVNDDVRALYQLHEAFFETFGTERFSALDVAQRVLQDDAINLKDAMLGATGRSEQLSSKSVGRYLRKFVDRIVEGRALRVLHGEKAMVYQMEVRGSSLTSSSSVCVHDDHLAA